MREYPYMSLKDVLTYEPEMVRLNVSKVARSPGGFLYNYKQINGSQKKLIDFWRRKRHAFISHLTCAGR